MCDPEPLDPCLLITAVENQRLQATVTGPDGWRDRCKQQQQQSGGGATLDEITNRVFEELLQGKTEDSSGPQSRPLSDHGSIRSEDWSSEHSSGIFGRFLRRDSAFLDKTRESRSKGKKCVPQQQQQVSKHASLDLDSPLLGSQPALAVGPTVTAAQAQAAAAKAKWKLRPQAHGRSESDELYEGLKRAQRRMDDQRGTEINFELPDFLKDKENAPQQRRLKKGRLTDMDVSLPLLGGGDGIDLSVTEGILPSPGQAEAYFSNHMRCSLSGEELTAPPAPPQRHNNAPPPLPPKPKTFPALPRSKWNPSVGFSSASEEDSGNNNTRPAAQSTTSFV
ncbi:hypothetical protein B566_EDAN002870 [Ephemera danica]|nr:hypothetical protein B566_EDAN002870 [Ephemera danica]